MSQCDQGHFPGDDDVTHIQYSDSFPERTGLNRKSKRLVAPAFAFIVTTPLNIPGIFDGDGRHRGHRFFHIEDAFGVFVKGPGEHLGGE